MKNTVIEPEISSWHSCRLCKSGSNARLHFQIAGISPLPFWSLRLWLGVRALFVGIQKYAAYKSVAMPLIDPSTGQPDASGVMVNVSVKSYALANYAGIPSDFETSSLMSRCSPNSR